MGNMTKLAIVIILGGLVGLAIGVLSKLFAFSIAGFSPTGWGQFTAICFLLSINLILLEKKA